MREQADMAILRIALWATSEYANCRTRRPHPTPALLAAGIGVGQWSPGRCKAQNAREHQVGPRQHARQPFHHRRRNVLGDWRRDGGADWVSGVTVMGWPSSRPGPCSCQVVQSRSDHADGCSVSPDEQVPDCILSRTAPGIVGGTVVTAWTWSPFQASA
jgi:hypothetical protein